MTRDTDWIEQAWQRVPDRCPHGRRPVVERIEYSQDGTYVRFLPGLLDCPPACYDELGAERVIADHQIVPDRGDK